MVGEAKDRFESQDYFGAVHLLLEVVESGSPFADAHHLLGLSYHMLGQSERALQSLDSALQLNPRYVEAQVHRALVLDSLGRGSEAAQDLDRARELGQGEHQGIPRTHAAKLANMHAALGEAYVETGALEHAIEQYRRGLELGPSIQDVFQWIEWLLLAVPRSV